MEDLKSAMEEHMEQMADLVQKFSAELRTGLRPAYDNFIGFFHAIDWKVPRSEKRPSLCKFYCFCNHLENFMSCGCLFALNFAKCMIPIW